eukprot:344338-Chlamydomonas_euryale.AAC.1
MGWEDRKGWVGKTGRDGMGRQEGMGWEDRKETQGVNNGRGSATCQTKGGGFGEGKGGRGRREAAQGGWAGRGSREGAKGGGAERGQQGGGQGRGAGRGRSEGTKGRQQQRAARAGSARAWRPPQRAHLRVVDHDVEASDDVVLSLHVFQAHCFKARRNGRRRLA